MEPTVTAYRGESLTGKKSGKWFIGRLTRKEGYQTWYECTCSCDKATVKEVNRAFLLQGVSKSCGCYRTEGTVARSTTHGGYHTPEHRVWASMLTRCTNPKYGEYHLYGGRGITVCEEWKDFKKFFDDMGPRPSPAHQIDRKNNDLGYSKSNCYWATKTQNARNKRTTVFVEYEGEQKPLVEVAEIIGVDYHALFYRYQSGQTGANLFRPSGAPKIGETK